MYFRLPQWLLCCGLAMGCSSLSVVGQTIDANDDSWPQWRGPSRDSQVVGSSWPEKLSEDRLTESWSKSLGPSYSGPIVVGDRVFVTETIDKKFESVRALERASGRQLWERRWEGAMSVPFFAASNGSWIRATPAYDDGRLYVAGMRDMLVCLEGETGEVVWQVDFVAETGAELPSFGCVCSPLVTAEHVYIQAAGGLVKLDKATGEILWRSLSDGGGMDGSAFSSPVLATMAGTEQLVVQTRTRLVGVALESGQELWAYDIPAFRGMNILTPTIIGDSIFTSSYGGKAWLISITRSGEQWQVAETWNNKSQGYMSSPVVVDGNIYLHLKNQRFTCIEATSGQERWTTQPFGKYWSMIANGDRLLALDQKGELLLIKASTDEFQLLDRRSVGGEAWAHVALAGQQLFVRTLDSMKCYQWK